MEMKFFRLFLQFLLPFCVLFVTPGAVKRFNIYDKKYIEDLCSSNESFHYFISNSGQSSAIKIGATRYSWLSSHRNCTITINPPTGRGVILKVHSIYFGNNILSNQCSDYFQIYDDKGNSTKLCGFLTPSIFVSSGKMRLRYYTSSSNSIPGVGFNIIATAFQKDLCDETQFNCLSGECIWKGFACDGIENCPDGSDEQEYETSYCADVGPFTMKPIDIDWNLNYPTSNSIPYRKSFNVTISSAIASAVLILFIGLMRYLCHNHCAQTRQQEVLRGIAIIRTRSTVPPNFQAPPPPYTSLVNEACCMPANPPEYSTVVSDSNVASSSTAAGGSDSLVNNTNQAPKQPTVSEPPPPYEP